MRILQVYYEPQASGQTTQVLSLAQGLGAKHFDLVVVLPEELGPATMMKRSSSRLSRMALAAPSNMDS